MKNASASCPAESMLAHLGLGTAAARFRWSWGQSTQGADVLPAAAGSERYRMSLNLLHYELRRMPKAARHALAFPSFPPQLRAPSKRERSRAYRTISQTPPRMHPTLPGPRQPIGQG